MINLYIIIYEFFLILSNLIICKKNNAKNYPFIYVFTLLLFFFLYQTVFIIIKERKIYKHILYKIILYKNTFMYFYIYLYLFLYKIFFIEK